ncbi:hypothetical protein K488DRAFT_42887 [Vararia minispora EC-137]|uniref:Uncharacterized protein n=1 Tax=Vararia minispora EC-137 TaxID=1314806 RepID=A0ACB8QV23_9AGAM|nr:hypothetical protein K488DRAFT_42887 [Vararia minispora EC-137]
MLFFSRPYRSSRHYNYEYTSGPSTSQHHRHRGVFSRKDPDRVAGGYKAALSNPNTSHQGRRRAKWELRRMGRGSEAHVPFMTKVRRVFGIRSTPRNRRSLATTTRTHRSRQFTSHY